MLVALLTQLLAARCAAQGTAEAKPGSCRQAMWMMRPGLDGSPDTVSFEAVVRPGFYVTAVGLDEGSTTVCSDAPTAKCPEDAGGGGGGCSVDSCKRAGRRARTLFYPQPAFFTVCVRHMACTYFTDF